MFFGMTGGADRGMWHKRAGFLCMFTEELRRSSCLDPPELKTFNESKAKTEKITDMTVIGIAVPVLHTGFPLNQVINPWIKVQKSSKGEWCGVR